MKKAIVLRHNGINEAIDLDADGGELIQLQTAVGGWVEAIQADAITTLWCNEEGKLKGLPCNDKATTLWWTLNPEAVGLDILCGDVVVTGSPDGDGETRAIEDSTALIIEVLQR